MNALITCVQRGSVRSLMACRLGSVLVYTLQTASVGGHSHRDGLHAVVFTTGGWLALV